MGGKVRRVDYAPDEYISGVGGKLRADEQGVFWMICSLIMSEGEAIVRDDQRIAGLCRIRPADARRITDRVIELGKLKVTDDGKLYQNRALSEVERSANRIQTASENGSKGGRPSKKDKENQHTPKAAGFDDEKLSLTINEQQVREASDEASQLRPKRTRRRVAYTPKFESFWKAYPTDPLMSKQDAFSAFEKLDDEQQDEVIASVAAFRAHCSSHIDYRPVHAVRYITQGRFEGFIASSKAIGARTFVILGSPAWTALLRHRRVQSMAHSDHEGKRGWWFDKSEVEAALNANEKAAA